MSSTIIIGSGSYIPENVIDKNNFLQSEFYDESGQKIDKNNEEIVDKFIEITEIAKRRYVDSHLLNSDIGAEAVKIAIEDAGIDKESVDYIIAATNFGDIDENGNQDFMPSLSAMIKSKVGIKNTKCVNYDMIFGCPGWVEGLILANTLIKSGRAKNIVVVGSETLSRATDPFDRDKMIFADGAGAVVVTATDEENVGIIADNTQCFNVEEIDFLKNSCSLNPNNTEKRKYVRMKGRKIYEFALKNVPLAIKETIDKAELSIENIDKILIHQANAKMDHAIADRLHRLYDIKNYDEKLTPMTVQEFGNTSVACIPTMYDLIIKNKMQGQEFKDNSNIVFASVGAGINVNAVVYRFPKK